MTEVMASLFFDVHHSTAKQTLSHDGNYSLIASAFCEHSLRQMFLRVAADTSTKSLRNTLYDSSSSRFDVALQGV